MISRICTLLLLLSLTACNDRVPGVIIQGNNGRPAVGADLPVYDMPVDLPPTDALCVPGERRCIAESSPLVESCAADGRGYVRDACPDGTICRDSRCAPFTCAANFPVCVGLTASATCAPDGRSVQGITQCEEGLSCRAGVCVDLCEVAATERSYIGCDYIARDLPNLLSLDPQTSDHPFAIVAANPHPLLPARVELLRTDAPGEPVGLIDELRVRPASGYQGVSAVNVRSELFSVTGNRPLTVEDTSLVLPPGGAAALLIDRVKGGAAAIRIKSDRPVVAYQYNPYCCNFTATNDASLLLPTSTLGTRYRVVGYPSMQFNGFVSSSYVSIIAADKPATVRITHTSELRRAAGTVEPGEPTQGRALSFTLKPYEEALVEADDDPTGASIASDVPVSVFVGHPCTNVPMTQFACDHLEDQLPPADTLGTRYLLPPVLSRGYAGAPEALDGVYWQIVADEDAILRFDPPLSSFASWMPPSHTEARLCRELELDGVVNLGKGQHCELGLLRAPVGVESDQPIAIAGVLSGHESTGKKFYGSQAGDPSLFMLPPIEQIRTSYAFVNPPTYKRTFATVAIPAGTPLVLDGRQLEDDRRLEPYTITMRGQRWDIFGVELTPDAHTLRADERFLLIVYAYDDYVSYAFPGGLDLLPRKKD